MRIIKKIGWNIKNNKVLISNIKIRKNSLKNILKKKISIEESISY